MRFLEAHRLVRELEGGERFRLLIGMSGTADPLLLYLRAAGAKRGLAIEPLPIPFGTLRQVLVAGLEEEGIQAERFVLMPWDLVPELDWRTGFPTRIESPEALRDRARDFLGGVDPERVRSAFYVPARLPPVHSHPDETHRLGLLLTGVSAEAGLQVWPRNRFSLPAYLASGVSLASAELGAAAEDIVRSLDPGEQEPKKVLVTDLDGVLWRGVLGDDGPEGIQCDPEGPGYPHFLYQSLLRRLRGEGTVLAVVSRNDPGLVDAAFERARLTVQRDDFVSVLASYGAKSAQIRELAQGLNLGTDSFVFVDDNPVELAEVEAALPEVTTLPYPESDEDLVPFFERLSGLFGKRTVTDEDARRTELYRARLDTIVPSDARGADLTSFLTDLKMRLEIHDRSSGDRRRAVQLINKTNQFNLNGIRRTDDEVEAMLRAGGRLYSARLSDRSGDHGEILACLMDEGGTLRSFVMSCRVFQRRVEHGFLAWLLERVDGTLAMDFRPTERNEPFRSFLEAVGGLDVPGAGVVRFPAEDVKGRVSDAGKLFNLTAPTPGRRTDPAAGTTP